MTKHFFHMKYKKKEKKMVRVNVFKTLVKKMKGFDVYPMFFYF